MSIYLGNKSDLEALQGNIELHGLNVVDVGCGKGDFAAAMAQCGATVTGIEPDPVQAQLNRQAEPLAGLNLLEARAEALPLDRASQDLLVFRFSLHHIPASLHAQVFREAARVLKSSGLLYVMEPLAEGSSQYVMELFHDETEVRARAQQALRELAVEHFVHAGSWRYEVVRHYADFEAYVQRYGKLTYNSYELDTLDNDAVRRRFLEHQQDAGVDLVQPVKADLFRHK